MLNCVQGWQVMNFFLPQFFKQIFEALPLWLVFYGAARDNKVAMPKQLKSKKSNISRPSEESKRSRHQTAWMLCELWDNEKSKAWQKNPSSFWQCQSAFSMPTSYPFEAIVHLQVQTYCHLFNGTKYTLWISPQKSMVQRQKKTCPVDIVLAMMHGSSHFQIDVNKYMPWPTVMPWIVWGQQPALQPPEIKSDCTINVFI